MLALAFLAGLPLGQAVTLIDYESSWHLWRGQRAPSKPDYWAWNKPDFDDSGWETAVSPIFFGEKVKGGTELTDMKSKYNSFFVRKKFDSPDPEHITSATLRAKVDDGFVAYINGTEVARYNVTTEKPKYSSKSTKAATEPLRFLNYEIDDFKSVLKNGENTLAIIVLNQRRTSPDVMFDAKLSVVSDESDPPMVASTLPPRGLAADLEQITVNFDEPVEGVDASDLLINGKPALAVTGGGRTWVFEPGPLSHGKVQLTWVQDHGITDQALTPNAFKATAAGNRWTYTFADDNPPHVRRANPPAGLAVKSLDAVEVEFSMPVNGVDAADLLINGQAAKSVKSLGANRYQFALGQAATGEVNISWADSTGITGNNPFEKPFLPLGWFYRVDPNAPPPPRIARDTASSTVDPGPTPASAKTVVAPLTYSRGVS